MKIRALKAKQDFSFWSYAKRRKVFSKINDSDKSSLQKEIIYRPNVIQSPNENDFIKVVFYHINGGVKTELLQKLLLQVSVCKLHMYMLKNMLLIFPLHTMKKNFSVLLILIFDFFFCHNYKINPMSSKYVWLHIIHPG